MGVIDFLYHCHIIVIFGVISQSCKAIIVVFSVWRGYIWGLVRDGLEVPYLLICGGQVDVLAKPESLTLERESSYRSRSDSNEQEEKQLCPVLQKL